MLPNVQGETVSYKINLHIYIPTEIYRTQAEKTLKNYKNQVKQFRKHKLPVILHFNKMDTFKSR